MTPSRRWRRLSLAALVPLAAFACDSSPSVSGELARGRFVYVCVEDTDALCSDFDSPDAFPAVFGPGGRFSVFYRAKDSDAVGITVEPSSSELLAFEDDVFTWQTIGDASLLAVLDGQLYDFVNIRADEVEHVRFGGVSPLDEVVLRAGETRVVDAIPQDQHGRRIGGALEYQWWTTDQAVAVVKGDASLERVTVRAVETGITTLVLDVGGSQHSVPIVVGPPSRDPCDRADLDSLSCEWCRAQEGLPWDDC